MREKRVALARTKGSEKLWCSPKLKLTGKDGKKCSEESKDHFWLRDLGRLHGGGEEQSLG